MTILSRSTAFGWDHNLVTVTQRLTDHLPVSMRKGTRELLWKVRAKRVILATGAHERPIVFGNNDLPGVMLAGAVSTYVHRFGVLPAATRSCSEQRSRVPDRARPEGVRREGDGRRFARVVERRAAGAAKRQGVTVMSARS